MWNIEFVVNKPYSCEQAILVEMAKLLGDKGDNHPMIFADSWGFFYYPDKKLIGQRISPGYRGSRKRNLELFCGVGIEDLKKINKKNFKTNVTEILCKSPVMIDFDTYFCPWSKYYLNKHIYHKLLIIDFNSNGFICYDHNVKNQVTLPYDIITSWEGKASIFYKKGIVVCWQDFRKELLNQYVFLKEKKMLFYLNEFFYDISHIDNYSQEFEYCNSMMECELLIGLNRIAKQRRCFAEYLNFLKSHEIVKIDDIFINSFINLSKMYDILRISITKEVIRGKIKNKSELLHKIFMNEKALFEKFEELIFLWQI